ncbi:MAG: arl14 effector protein, partial [Paramarteilia canceri]
IGYKPGEMAPANDDGRSFLSTTGCRVYQMIYNSMVFAIWDVGGQPTDISHWPLYLNDPSVVFFVVDSLKNVQHLASEDQSRFKQVLDWIDEGNETKSNINKPFIYVLLTKRDVESGLNSVEMLNYIKVDKLCKERNFKFHVHEVSSNHKEDLEKIKATLFDTCLNQIKTSNMPVKKSVSQAANV